MPALPRAVADLLAGYSPEVQALTKKARQLVLQTLPGVTEQADPADKLLAYGYGLKMGDIVAVLMPLKTGVNLGLPHGVALPDPAKLLQGTGKRHRHVRLSTPADVDNPALLALLRASAARHAAEHPKK